MASPAQSRPVLVTGASSGIGRALVIRLAGRGYPVFATARKPGDLDALAGLANVTPVRLDVRDADQVAAAVHVVRSAGRGLHALVNNAGIGGIGPIAAFTDDEVRDLFDVNVFGVVRMVRAFLPLVLESRGRIVIVGSQGGSISSRYYGPYTMTKHALEALVIALDAEIRPHGGRVAIVQPGGVRTAIGDNAVESDRDRFRRAGPPFDVEAREFLPGLDSLWEFDPNQPESVENRRVLPPEAVADAVIEVIEAPEPRLRTLVGSRWEGDRVITTLLRRLVEANECPSLRYSSQELMEKLRRIQDEQER